MDTTAQLPLQAYGNLSSAAKQQTPFMFNFDQSAAKNVETTMGANTAGKHMLPPLSVTGNDKFEWGNQLTGGPLASPNIYQKPGFAYTPIITGAQYSSLANGQNFFNFANAAINDDQQIQQITNLNNAGTSGSNFSATPQGITQLYGDNLNQLYGNQGFNNNNMQGSVTANSMIQSQQQNFAQQNSGINTIGGVNSHQMKIGQSNVAQPSQFIPQQQQQFPQQQAQQTQQNQQVQQQQISQHQQHQQQYQNFQKNQFLNGQFTNFSNNQADQQFQGDPNQNMNQIANTLANTAQNPQQQLAAVTAAATGNISAERKKPQIQLSLQIPQGNSVNSNNITNPQNNSTNPNNTIQNTNGPLTADGNGFTNYFQQYQNNIGLAPFTPIGPTTMGLQQLNGAPPSSHLPPFTQRTGNQQYDNFFFNAPTNIQQIPDQYPLLTPGNTGYNKQSFFYPTADQTAPATAQSQLQQIQYDQNKFQHPLTSQYQQYHSNNPQNMQQHQNKFQQQQQMQQNPYQQPQSQNPQQQQQHQQIVGSQVNIGIDQQKNQINSESNDQNKKNLNLKLDVSMNKDNNFGTSSGDQKKGLLNFGSGILDSTGKVGGQSGQQDDDKDKNIMQMLQKNNPQGNISQSNYLDAANMTLIIDFYQKANPEKKQQLFDFLSNQQSDDKDDNQKNKSQKIIEYIITANTKRIGTLTLQQRSEKLQRYREKRQRRSSTSLVKYKKQQVAVSKKPRDKNGKFLKQAGDQTKEKKKIKKN